MGRHDAVLGAMKAVFACILGDEWSFQIRNMLQFVEENPERSPVPVESGQRTAHVCNMPDQKDAVSHIMSLTLSIVLD